MLPIATKPKSQKNKSFLVHFLTQFGPKRDSFAFFTLKLAGSLPLMPESLQLRDIVTKTHLCIFTKILESLKKAPFPAHKLIKIRPPKENPVVKTQKETQIKQNNAEILTNPAHQTQQNQCLLYKNQLNL
ncbi:hypothetical protein TorRG33x02_156820 [Trema orientale]|uniref:Uncharacterized protein n=1 Tax=Trema orientale TaxID=63057 RepID=A0A2P5ESE8_TREOI|nr:hypothetical protein TorRG33x02_156820 [Trema orientale]